MWKIILLYYCEYACAMLLCKKDGKSLDTLNPFKEYLLSWLLNNRLLDPTNPFSASLDGCWQKSRILWEKDWWPMMTCQQSIRRLFFVAFYLFQRAIPPMLDNCHFLQLLCWLLLPRRSGWTTRCACSLSMSNVEDPANHYMSSLLAYPLLGLWLRLVI